MYTIVMLCICYIVVYVYIDYNIAKANIKEGCKKINFLDKSIKDSYLEKFKIVCLIVSSDTIRHRLIMENYGHPHLFKRGTNINKP